MRLGKTLIVLLIALNLYGHAEKVNVNFKNLNISERAENNSLKKLFI